MGETILVPLDGSGAGQIVLPYVEEIAARIKADVILVSVSDAKAGDIDHLYRSYLENIKSEVQSQLTAYGAGDDVKVYEEVLLGEPANEILRYADESKVSLIIMASRGASGRGPWLLGNIAAKILRAAHMPVLLVRSPVSASALLQKRVINRILVPLDGSKVGEAALPRTETLAKALGAEIILFQVIEPLAIRAAAYDANSPYIIAHDDERERASAQTYLATIAKAIQEKGLTVSVALGAGYPADQIIDYARANNIDLIAMSTHGRTGIGRWVFGSVTDKVLHAGDTAILIVRAAKTTGKAA